MDGDLQHRPVDIKKLYDDTGNNLFQVKNLDGKLEIIGIRN